MDGFIDVRELIEVLLSYISQNESAGVNLASISNLIPNLDTQSPMTRCE